MKALVAHFKLNENIGGQLTVKSAPKETGVPVATVPPAVRDKSAPGSEQPTTHGKGRHPSAQALKPRVVAQKKAGAGGGDWTEF